MDRLSPLGVAFMSPRYNIALTDARRCRIDRLDLIYDRSRDMQRDVLNRPRHSRIVLLWAGATERRIAAVATFEYPQLLVIKVQEHLHCSPTSILRALHITFTLDPLI